MTIQIIPSSMQNMRREKFFSGKIFIIGILLFFISNASYSQSNQNKTYWNSSLQINSYRLPPAASDQVIEYIDLDGDGRLKVQAGNPHPYTNYPTMGISLAAFIQRYRSQSKK